MYSVDTTLKPTNKSKLNKTITALQTIRAKNSPKKDKISFSNINPKRVVGKVSKNAIHKNFRYLERSVLPKISLIPTFILTIFKIRKI